MTIGRTVSVFTLGVAVLALAAMLVQGSSHRETLEIILELKLEGDVFYGIAVVIDVNLIQGLRIEEEIVGSAIGILQREVIGNQRHEPSPAVFVAAEHVEVRPIYLGMFGDKRRLTMARALHQHSS